MRSKLPKQVETYIKKRALDNWLNYDIEKSYQIIVVVPAIKEFENIPMLLKALSENEKLSIEKTLILFVVNNSEVSSNEVIENNMFTINYLKELKNKPNRYGLNIDFIDASSKGNTLPAKDAGVGLARKIGMDQALLYFNYSHNGNAIVCLDADCEVGTNYLTEIQKYFENKCNTAVIKYEHRLDNEAIINYEIFLRYYVLGLKFAKSPYAYHSIGSCIALDPLTYVKIGGMNKKKAGEDFYFLEKAAKLKEVVSIDTTTVYPSSRKSWRVPFGTGQRMTRFYEKIRDEYVLYNPKSFVVLRDFLRQYFSEDLISPEELLVKAKSISNSLYEYLIINNFKYDQQKIIDNSKTLEQLKHQKKIWFDAFKTLKLIHYLRDTDYPEQAMFTALNSMIDMHEITDFDKHISENLPPLEIQIEYMNLLRRLT